MSIRSGGWTRGDRRCVAIGFVACAAVLGACDRALEPGPDAALAEVREALTTADACNAGEESLPAYAQTCANAMGGLNVPKFDCRDGVEVPDTQGDGVAYPNETCDRPNVLNGECDPGSNFQ